MKVTFRLVLVPAVAVASVGIFVQGASAATPPRSAVAGSRVERALAPAGTVTAAARSVDAAALPATSDTAGASAGAGPLGRDGRPTGGLPVQPSGPAKPTPPARATAVGIPNLDPTRPTVTPRTAPTHKLANFAGVSQSGSNCGGCQPPDVNAAVGATQIVEAVNLRLQVYNKTGGKVCGFALSALTGDSGQLSDPRVQYDNVKKRFSLVLIPVPTSTTAVPAMYILATKTANPCGAWWVYRTTFSGTLYPKGALLDYPYLGQDRLSLLFSSNNYVGDNYIDSAAFAVPKSKVYAGAAFSASAFGVDMSTAPVTVAGIPTFSTTSTYFLASVPGVGYDLYRMTNSAGPGTTMTLQATIAAPFDAPTRRINQPGTAQTLDPLDGRIVWAPVQDGNFVWFTHGIDLGGYPSVRYGAISTVDNSATVAVAYHSGTSDDFNPSIGVVDAGNNLNRIWVNWAYTDTAAGVPTSDTVDGVLPGDGVPNLIGTGLVLVTGTATSSNFRFGDFSSVAIDASDTTGCIAVTAQEYFGTGGWKTRIARLSLC